MPRRAALNTLWTLLLAALVSVAGLVLLLAVGGPRGKPQAKRLSIYCAAGMRVPVERIARRYQEEYGVQVDLQFGGSNTLLTQLEIDKFSTADLYLAADQFYTDLALQKGLAAETFPVATMQPVVAVRADSEKSIATLDDLLDPEMRVVLANPDQAAIGRTVRARLEALPAGDTTRWRQLEVQVTRRGVFKPTVSDVANDIKLGGHVDAGIVWDTTVRMPKYRDVLRAVTLPELTGAPQLVSLAVLRSSRNPTAALRFARYLTASDRGAPIFEEDGVTPVPGDAWVERPQLTFFCGAVNRRAVDRLVQEFAAREGVEVNTIYDGCGTLTSRMKAIEGQQASLGFPDVYLACDEVYLENVRQWFEGVKRFSDTEVVIAVPKGSNRVDSLEDLVQPGVRVAIGDPDLCTIGALTRRLLAREELYEKLREKQRQPGEVVVDKSSSAMLVPDVATGSVDAAIVYLTDTLPNRDRVDVVRIDSPLNVAVQPFSIARGSASKQLARRLRDKLARSPDAFEEAGFHFRRSDGPTVSTGGGATGGDATDGSGPFPADRP